MTKADAETKLAQCHGCTKDCNECTDIDAVLNAVMLAWQEIHVQEVAYDADIDYLFSLAG